MPKINIQPDFSDSFCFPENSEEWRHVLIGKNQGFMNDYQIEDSGNQILIFKLG